MTPNLKKRIENGSGSGGYQSSISKYLVRNGRNPNNNHTEHPFKKQKMSPDQAKHNDNKLPVAFYKGKFFELLNENKSIIVVGQTGSGKTTQIPQWCLDYCVRKTKQASVACTQPRRIAAMSIAERVASERNVQLGQEVGYAVRFESKTSDRTRLKYLTDGMLLREAMLDETLSAYAIIILDEAHERTLQTEILFGVVKRAFKVRNNPENEPSRLPLKVIIMSATINVKLFQKYFESPILSISGRQHPVQDLFTEVPQSDLLTSTLICVFQIHRTCEDGDILVFCSGQDEIQSLITLTKKVLKQAPDNLKNLEALPLYAGLPAGAQMKVFNVKSDYPKTNGLTNGYKDHGDSDSSSGSNGSAKDKNKFVPNPSSTIRRVIYATNVAETSITIPNIKYVIDTGKVKCRYFCPKTGLESLKVTNISKAQAKQRAGRAGRVAPGTCYHLYTNDYFSRLVDHLPPEIKRCNLDGVILQMISVGIKNLNAFDFLEKPDEDRLKAALTNLLSLRAIKQIPPLDKANHETEVNDHNRMINVMPKRKNLNLNASESNSILYLSYDLTAIGKKLCLFPLNPAMSRILLAAEELGCLEGALTVVSLLSIENLFYIPPNKQSQAEVMLKRFFSNEGDAIMLLNVYRAFKRTLKLNKAGAKSWCLEHFIHMKNLKMAIMIRKQLLALCKSAGMRLSSSGQATANLRKALTYGLFNNVASMHDGKYRNKSLIEVYIHPSSCLFKARPETILYVEVVETNKCYMRTCTLVDIDWVREVSYSNSKH